ncbi:MAG TPA: glycosyltransferase family 2 protein [Ktedonobacteraceae bacterium]|nr:glycosyltransferase family 2 protein [Ktedonobacteraceae bacterium]
MRTKKTKEFPRILAPIIFAQAILGVRVVLRLLCSAGGERISTGEARVTGEERISVIVPVLNEYKRLSSCMEGLIAQGSEVAEILVVDGGSDDDTQQLACTYAARDPRVRLEDASPIPLNVNGKAWGLQVGLRSAYPGSQWILIVDADVRPGAFLARALLGRAIGAQLSALSIATLQEIDSIGEGLLHPSLLTTLVYRFGIPGKAFRQVSKVQANGQCFLFRRDALEACGGFVKAYHSVCEDVTVARTLVAAGHPVGFYEAGDLVSVKMYTDWRDAWRNWPRSLPMHDQYSSINTWLGWLEVALVQALPLPLFLLLVLVHARRSWSITLNGVLAAMRIGMLFGTARAYRRRSWSYWLSPFCDLPVAIKLGKCALQRKYVWRGYVLVRGGSK